MIKENNVVPLFGIPLCQTQIKPYEESEKFIKEKLDYELRSHKVSYCLLYTSPSPRDRISSRMPSSA